MSKKLMERVAKALKDAGVELTAEGKSALADTLGSDALTAAGFVELGSNQKVIDESELNSINADRRKLRERAQTAEDQLATTKADVEKYKPLADALLPRVTADWTKKSALIPVETEKMSDADKAKVKNLRGSFIFPETGKELSVDQMVANLKKYDEYENIGVLAAEPVKNEPAPSPPPAPRGGNSGSGPIDLNAAYDKFYGDPKAVGNAR